MFEIMSNSGASLKKISGLVSIIVGTFSCRHHHLSVKQILLDLETMNHNVRFPEISTLV